MSSSSPSPAPAGASSSASASPAIVTPLVASVLSRCRVDSSLYTTLPAGSALPRATPAFRVRRIEERLALGDIVALASPPSQSAPGAPGGGAEYALITRILEPETGSAEHGAPARLEGVILVAQERTPLAPIGPRDELFRTLRTWHGRASSEHIVGRVEGARVRFAYDEQTCALVPLDNAGAAPPPSPSLELHEHDFVYLDALPPSTSVNDGAEPAQAPWRIAQLRKLSARGDGAHVVRLFERTRAIDGFEDEQLLVKGKKMTLSSAECIRGKCYVETVRSTQEKDRLRGVADVFYVAAEVKQCPLCVLARQERERVERRLTKHRLKSLDLFAGAGGLCTGAVLSGLVKCKWANDRDAAAAKTFESLHTKVQVDTRDCNVVLRDIIEGRKPPLMPDPAEGLVDVITAGPPCQGFSRANMSTNDKSRPMDPRNMLVATTLAFVDVYRPRFVVLENVGGLVDPANGKLGEVPQGFLKLILTCFIEMGYGVRCHIAQAADYGVAQSRPRIIFLASRADEVLPDFPLQTHAGFKKATPKQFKVEGCEARITSCRRLNGAPLPAVTAGAVLSDLPMFDWTDPHVIYPDKNDSHDQWRRKRAQVIPSFEIPKRGSSDRIGPRSPCAYRSAPRNSHQLALRQSVPGSSISSTSYRQAVTQHQTTVLSLDASERVCNVKLAPNANYESWPAGKPRLATWGYSSLAAAVGRSSTTYPKSYLRADPTGPLQISMARMDPGSKSGGNLHWDQYRLLTVREVARAQGFPDGVHFETEDGFGDAIRQVGNAVPVPLARAVFRSIIRARVDRELLAARATGTGTASAGTKEEKKEPADAGALKRKREVE